MAGPIPTTQYFDNYSNEIYVYDLIYLEPFKLSNYPSFIPKNDLVTIAKTFIISQLDGTPYASHPPIQYINKLLVKIKNFLNSCTWPPTNTVHFAEEFYEEIIRVDKKKLLTVLTSHPNLQTDLINYLTVQLNNYTQEIQNMPNSTSGYILQLAQKISQQVVIKHTEANYNIELCIPLSIPFDTLKSATIDIDIPNPSAISSSSSIFALGPNAVTTWSNSLGVDIDVTPKIINYGNYIGLRFALSDDNVDTSQNIITLTFNNPGFYFPLKNINGKINSNFNRTYWRSINDEYYLQ